MTTIAETARTSGTHLRTTHREPVRADAHRAAVQAQPAAPAAPAPPTALDMPAPLTDRQRVLIERYHALLTRPDDALRDAMATMIRAEFSLPEAEHYAFTYARLRAWLALDREDARIIARAYEDAMGRFSSEQQAQRLAAERDAIMNGLRFAEFRALCGIVPWLRSESSIQVLFSEYASTGTPGEPIEGCALETVTAREAVGA